jgi:hypothetical protein
MLKRIPGMWNNAQKDKKEQQKAKSSQNFTHKLPKRRILWGRMEWTAIWGIYIASVGPPLGRYINAIQTRSASEMSRLVAGVWTINLNRPPDAGRPRPDVKQLSSGHLSSIPVRTPRNYRPDAPHWDIRKLREIYRNQIFPKSVSEYACINHW